MNQKQPKQTRYIDWKKVKLELAQVQKRILQGFELSDEKKKNILKTRAKTLALEADKYESEEDNLEVIEFVLAGENYCIETEYVREVYQLKELTPLPCTPSYVLGIINVHGQIISVIDIKKFFNLPEKGITDLNKVIIIYIDTPVINGIEGMEFGILTDVIVGVKSYPLNKIETSLPVLTSIRKDYLKGVTSERSVILDAKKILSDNNIIIHDEVEV